MSGLQKRRINIREFDEMFKRRLLDAFVVSQSGVCFQVRADLMKRNAVRRVECEHVGCVRQKSREEK
jgi:hypothetical protein